MCLLAIKIMTRASVVAEWFKLQPIILTSYPGVNSCSCSSTFDQSPNSGLERIVEDSPSIWGPAWMKLLALAWSNLSYCCHLGSITSRWKFSLSLSTALPLSLSISPSIPLSRYLSK